MATPSEVLATLRPDLGASFEEFNLQMDSERFIGQRVMPVFETVKQSGKFGKIPLEQLLQNRETSRAPGAGFNRSSFKFTSASFSTDEHGAEEPVDSREAAMYADYFDAEVVATSRAMRTVIESQEKRVSDLIFNATTWAGGSLTTAVTNEWDDWVNATPIADVEAAVNKVYDGSGLWPNALIISRKVFRNLRNCAEIIDRLKYNGIVDVRAENLTASALAQVFDLPQIIVAGGTKNTANEGQSASIAPIWSTEYAMVARVAETGDIREPCLGRIFHWGEDGSQPDGLIESYIEPQTKSTIIRARHDVDEIVLYTEAGHLLSNITT